MQDPLRADALAARGIGELIEQLRARLILLRGRDQVRVVGRIKKGDVCLDVGLGELVDCCILLKNVLRVAGPGTTGRRRSRRGENSADAMVRRGGARGAGKRAVSCTRRGRVASLRASVRARRRPPRRTWASSFARVCGRPPVMRKLVRE
mgnify:CR=1 FL=1